MAIVTIEIPDDVHRSISVLSQIKGVTLDQYCLTAFVAGLNKTLRKGFKK